MFVLFCFFQGYFFFTRREMSAQPPDDGSSHHEQPMSSVAAIRVNDMSSDCDSEEEMFLQSVRQSRATGNRIAEAHIRENDVSNPMTYLVHNDQRLLPPSLSSTRSVSSVLSLPSSLNLHNSNAPPPHTRSHHHRSRSWMVTYHGPDAANVDLEYMQASIGRANNQSTNTRVTFVTWQIETAPTTGNTHVQMYIEFNTVVRNTYVQQLFAIPRSVYAAPRAGTRDGCIQYCHKEDTRQAGPFTIGDQEQTAPQQGNRTDVQDIHSMIASGARSSEIYTAFPNAYMRMVNGVRHAMAVVRQRDAPRERDIRVIVLYGQTGTGKTFGIVNQPNCDLYTIDSSMLQANTGNVWWDGYEGEKHVLFDEYNDWFNIAGLLKYLDRYAMRIQSKGSSTVAYYNTLYITSNKAPWEWKDRNGEDFADEHKAALQRRIHTTGEVKICDKGKTRIIELQKLNGRICDKQKIIDWIGASKVEHYENVFAAMMLERDNNNEI